MDAITSNMAADGIRKAGSFNDLAEWFASAFDTGPAGGFNGIATAAKNIDAIHALAQKLKQAQAVYNDENADIEDRIDATQKLNSVASTYNIPLPNGGSINDKSFEKITGLKNDRVKTLMTGNAYADMKLTELQEQAQTVAARAGVAPQAAIQRAKEIQAEIEQATIELNAKAGPVCDAWQKRFDDAQESTGYKAKVQESLSVINGFKSKRDFLIINTPIQPKYFAPRNERDAFAAKFRAWQEELDIVDAERQKALAPLQVDMLALYDKANDLAGDINSAIGPMNQAHNAFVASKKAEIAEARSAVHRLWQIERAGQGFLH
jgi:hypothetical protein